MYFLSNMWEMFYKNFLRETEKNFLKMSFLEELVQQFWKESKGFYIGVFKINFWGNFLTSKARIPEGIPERFPSEISLKVFLAENFLDDFLKDLLENF